VGSVLEPTLAVVREPLEGPGSVREH
jgi:hypothetical protein